MKRSRFTDRNFISAIARLIKNLNVYVDVNVVDVDVHVDVDVDVDVVDVDATLCRGTPPLKRWTPDVANTTCTAPSSPTNQEQ